MRRAWEQAAACVIASSAGMSAGSGAGLAERLGVTLIFVDEDPLVTAVRVASAAARPEAARTQLVARCATRLAEAGASARRVLGVLNSELQGNAVALLDPWGSHLAGRRAQGPSLAEVDIPDASGGTLAVLVAHGSFQSPGWPSVVNAVLGLAVTPLVAWAATERLAAERDVALQSALATRLLTLASSRARASVRTGDVREGTGPPGTAQGAMPEGRTRRRAGTERSRGRSPSTGRSAVRSPPTPSGATTPTWTMCGWSGRSSPRPWGPAPCCAVTRAGRDGRRCRPTGSRPPGRVSRRPAGALCGGSRHAGARPRRHGGVAARGGGRRVRLPGRVVARADRMGPAKLLAALPGGVLRAPAQMILDPLLSVDRDGTLLETLTAVLDEGGASRAAERLGIHRNTVTTRLERIRAAGFDVDDPGTRLALHLAAHVLRPRPIP
ncbi:PucR family transcriptional regulator [Streptosporangium lutulentum]